MKSADPRMMSVPVIESNEGVVWKKMRSSRELSQGRNDGHVLTIHIPSLGIDLKKTALFLGVLLSAVLLFGFTHQQQLFYFSDEVCAIYYTQA